MGQAAATVAGQKSARWSQRQARNSSKPTFPIWLLADDRRQRRRQSYRAFRHQPANFRPPGPLPGPATRVRTCVRGPGRVGPVSVRTLSVQEIVSPLAGVCTQLSSFSTQSMVRNPAYPGPPPVLGSPEIARQSGSHSHAVLADSCHSPLPHHAVGGKHPLLHERRPVGTQVVTLARISRMKTTIHV